MECLIESDDHVNGVMKVQHEIGGKVYDTISDIPRRIVHGLCEGFDSVFGSSLPVGDNIQHETNNITNIPREIAHRLCEGFDFVFGSNLPIPKVTQGAYVPGERPYTPSEKF